MGKLHLDVDVVVTLRDAAAAALTAPWTFTFDPADGGSESSTGWAVIFDRSVVRAGENRDPVNAVLAAFTAAHATPMWDQRPRRRRLHVVEEPFLIKHGNQWKLARAHGMIIGALRILDPDVPIWTPKPATWRAAAELNVGSRGDVAVAVADFVEQRAGMDLHKSPDGASAVAIGIATLEVFHLLNNPVPPPIKTHKPATTRRRR